MKMILALVCEECVWGCLNHGLAVTLWGSVLGAHINVCLPSLPLQHASAPHFHQQRASLAAHKGPRLLLPKVTQRGHFKNRMMQHLSVSLICLFFQKSTTCSVNF